MSPSGNTRPRDHDASPDPLFLARCPRRSLAKTARNCSKLLLCDKRCDSSVDYGNIVQLIGLEAVASPLARRAVSVLLLAPLVVDAA